MSMGNASPPEGVLGRVLKGFERVIVVALVVMMMVVVALSTLELGWIMVQDIITPPILLFQVEELLRFGFFLLILIGVELLKTIKTYLRDSVVHVEIVLEVALIAIARKVIVLDFEKYDGLSVLAIAALVITLAGALFLKWRRLRGGGTPRGRRHEQGPPQNTGG